MKQWKRIILEQLGLTKEFEKLEKEKELLERENRALADDNELKCELNEELSIALTRACGYLAKECREKSACIAWECPFQDEDGCNIECEDSERWEKELLRLARKGEL